MSSAPPLYLQLAERIRAAISSGSLAAGERLPSVRQQAALQRLSAATVVQAYRWLEDQHWLEARHRSGYFVAARRPPARPRRTVELAEPAQSQPPATAELVQIQRLSLDVMEAVLDKDKLSFAAATPEALLFDEERVRRALSRAVLQHRRSLCDYDASGTGEPGLRKAIARQALDLGCSLAPDDLLVTASCTQATALALRAVTRPGDTVAIESPTFFGFLQVLAQMGLKALEIPTHPRQGMSMDALQLAMETQPVKAVLVVPTLSNPLGAIMPTAERQRLARLAQTHGVAVIEDVVFCGLTEPDARFNAVRSHDPSGFVMVCGSFSKTVAPGLRLGWVDAGRWRDQVLHEARMTGVTQLIPAQAALAELLNQTGHAAGLRRLRARLRQRLAEARALIGQSFPPGTRVTDPRGGYSLWVELPAGMDSLSLYHRASAEGISFTPGTMFSSSGRFEHCLRLGVGAWTDAHRQALRRLGAMARAQREAGARRAA